MPNYAHRLTGAFRDLDRGQTIVVDELDRATFTLGQRRQCLAKVSSPRESHPEALPEPYVNLSIHTAPMVEVV